MSKKRPEHSSATDPTGSIVEERASEVGMSKHNRNVFVLVGLLAVFGVSYYVFSNSDTKDNSKKERESSISIEAQRENSIPVARDFDRIETLPPKIPDIPELVAPPAPQLPAAAPPLPTGLAPVVAPQDKLPTIPSPPQQPQQNNFPAPVLPLEASPNSQSAPKAQDRASQMLVVAGAGVATGDPSSDQGFDLGNPLGLLNRRTISQIKDSLNDKPTVSETASLARTPFPQVQTTYVGIMDYIVAQGKMIDAVIESAINTDLKGMLRAIVQRDVYSEGGYNVLIPRGSRLIGQYDSNISFGQSRVSVVWDRLMLPNGIDIAVASPATDTLGRAGLDGKVDAKFGNVFVNALLISAIKVGTGALVARISGSNNNNNVKRVVNTIDNTITTEGSGAALVANDAAQQTSDSITQYLERYKDNKPTITINQGDKIKVFVNKDIVFSKEALIH